MGEDLGLHEKKGWCKDEHIVSLTDHSHFETQSASQSLHLALTMPSPWTLSPLGARTVGAKLVGGIFAFYSSPFCRYYFFFFPKFELCTCALGIASPTHLVCSCPPF